MAQSDIPILVVDDAKFSTTVITRNLNSGGYTNIFHATSAKAAIAMQEEKPASIIIADWLMPEMDGLEMTKRIRQIEESSNRYTYIIMLTARDGMEALKHAFDEGVDDFVNKAVMQQQLLPRIFAAERLVNRYDRLLRDSNELLNANQQLSKTNQALKGLCTLDSMTGLGNKAYAISKLVDNLKHSESRGGATCLLLVRITNVAELEKKYPKPILREIIIGISRRLKGLVRPLDDVSRISNYTWAVITHQPDITYCEGKSFRRVLDAINHRAFRTSMGFQSISVDMSIAAATLDLGLPTPEVLFSIAEQKMAEAESSHRIEHIHYKDTSKV
jgi:PleD family two-component response regulator